LLYWLVQRRFGTLAGFVAGVALAITPIAVAVERGNNTDSLLTCTPLVAPAMVLRATETGRLAWLAGGMALVGVAFNIKMLEAFIVLPAFYALYFFLAPVSWPKRIAHLAVASIALAVTTLSWPLAVELIPPDQRPWVGGSQTNSVFDLALNYNGVGRVTGEGEMRGGG